MLTMLARLSPDRFHKMAESSIAAVPATPARITFNQSTNSVFSQLPDKVKYIFSNKHSLKTLNFNLPASYYEIYLTTPLPRLLLRPERMPRL
jgi:hypothetical protein